MTFLDGLLEGARVDVEREEATEVVGEAAADREGGMRRLAAAGGDG